MAAANTKSIAVIADAHANLPALQAVLKDIRRRDIDQVWYLGDFLGYGAFPNEVVDEIRSNGDRVIVGNHDLSVIHIPDERLKRLQRKNYSKFLSFGWTQRNLSPANRSYLLALPPQLKVRALETDFLLVHGSPARIDEPLTRSMPDLRFEELADQVRADVVLCGHTHVYFDRSHNDVRFINPGSVGRPFDGDPRASYAVLTRVNREIQSENIRVKYNVQRAVQAMQQRGFADDMIQSIAEGQSLDTIQAQKDLENKRMQLITAAMELAIACCYEKKHAHHVTDLSMRLFDELEELHGLNDHDRMLLEAAAILHDIGWISGRSKHHKTSRNIILADTLLPLSREDRIMVALIARYHRRAAPQDSHRYYRNLSEMNKGRVRKMAGLLRIADGLDRRHISAVKDLTCMASDDRVVIHVVSDGLGLWEKNAALKKSDVFCAVMNRTLNIKVN